MLPPQPVARKHPGPLWPDAVEHWRECFECFLGLDQADGPQRLERPSEDRVLAREIHLPAKCGGPIAEAPVNRLLGGPQGGQRLAPLMDVVELAPHEGAQDTAPAMRRVDA